MSILTKLIFKFILVVCSLVMVVGCTSPATAPTSTAEGVNQSRDIRDIYQAISITPQPNNRLCWNTGDSLEQTEAQWNEFIANPMFEEGLAFVLFVTDGAEVLGRETHRIAPNTPIHLTYRGYYHNANDSSASQTVRYIALLNEQQLPNAFDDSDTPYHDMVFNYHETQTFDITVPALDEGIHEFILIGVQQADLSNLGNIGLFQSRLTLIVGNPPLVFDATNYVSVEPYEYRTSANADNYWSVNVHGDQSQKAWAYPEVYKPATNQLDFYISTGYMISTNAQVEHDISPQSQPIALITLLDYVQVPFQQDKMVFYGILSPDNAYSFIPASIDVSGESRKRELLVVQISYPRFPNCFLFPSQPEGRYFSFAVSARRYGIDVQN